LEQHFYSVLLAKPLKTLLNALHFYIALAANQAWHPSIEKLFPLLACFIKTFPRMFSQKSAIYLLCI